MLMWWGRRGVERAHQRLLGRGDVVGFGINPGSDRRYNAAAGAWEETYNEAPNMAYIGWASM